MLYVCCSPKVRGENAALVYGNFSDPKATSKVYQEISDHSSLTKVMEEYLEDYNAVTNKPMSLVLFQVRTRFRSRCILLL